MEIGTRVKVSGTKDKGTVIEKKYVRVDSYTQKTLYVVELDSKQTFEYFRDEIRHE